jgi:hypothetical protein
MLPARLRAVLGAMAENGQLAAMLVQSAGGKPALGSCEKQSRGTAK